MYEGKGIFKSVDGGVYVGELKEKEREIFNIQLGMSLKVSSKMVCMKERDF